MRIRFILTALAGFVGVAACCASASAHDYGRYGVKAESRAYEREMAYQKYLAAKRKREETRVFERENAYQRYLASERKRTETRAFERGRDYGRDRGYGRYRAYGRYRTYGRYRAYGRHCDCPPYREYSYVPRVYSYSYHSDLCLP